jgi:hypothetical protein
MPPFASSCCFCFTQLALALSCEVWVLLPVRRSTLMRQEEAKMKSSKQNLKKRRNSCDVWMKLKMKIDAIFSHHFLFARLV